MSDLVTAAVEYGSEHVNSSMTEEKVEVYYMDQQAVERRLGAKTRFQDVASARMLRIRPRAFANERAVLVSIDDAEHTSLVEGPKVEEEHINRHSPHDRIQS